MNTLLTYLELDDVIEATAPFYSEYKFQFLRPEAEVLARFDAERAAFLQSAFAAAKRARTWATIDLDEAATRLKSSRERLSRAFGYLEEKGDIVLQASGVRQGYRRRTRLADRDALERSLVERFETRERNDVARTRQVLALVEEPGCLVRRLLAHFGEELGRECGHCGPCLGEQPARLPGRERSIETRVDAEEIAELRAGHPGALGTPRQLARFLCGSRRHGSRARNSRSIRFTESSRRRLSWMCWRWRGECPRDALRGEHGVEQIAEQLVCGGEGLVRCGEDRFFGLHEIRGVSAAPNSLASSARDGASCHFRVKLQSEHASVVKEA